MSDTTTDKTSTAEPKVGKHPTFKLNLGNISVAVFADEKSTREGERFTAQNIVLQKSWKQADGEFDSRSLNLDPRDVMKVIAGLQQAYLATYDATNA